ncbi:hypothetical protein GOBAR_AA16292 [Gossypium barbadense]|uniref:Uncharacterized protein n=1 Tax=Gossypium barbadense TaxID=3634 RepID=A0A2P5XM33_GOSBA|nr:hypothetical protein GOBAR_AA16292 [Gossypium barbadense]
MSSSHGKKTAIPASKKRKGAASSSGPVTVMTNFDYPGTVQFSLGGLVRQLSIPEFGIALEMYTEEYIDDNELDTLHFANHPAMTMSSKAHHRIGTKNSTGKGSP